MGKKTKFKIRKKVKLITLTKGEKNMTKYKQFYLALVALKNTVRGKSSTNAAKLSIGDSINNNRTLTVSQAVRLLNVSKAFDFAQELEIVRQILDPVITKNRTRTDAIDINELLVTYEKKVLNGKGKTNNLLRRQIGTTLSKVN